MKRVIVCLLFATGLATITIQPWLDTPQLQSKPELAASRVLSTEDFREHFETVAGSWKEAAKSFMFERMYPYEELPYGVYQRAAAHRDRMEPAPIGLNRGPHGPNGSWQFLGPRNLDIPHRRFWGPAPVSGRISAVVFDPSDPTTLYASSGFGGLAKSTNNGSTWTVLSDNWELTHVSSIAIDPSDSQRIYVGTGDYKTTGGGPGLGYGIGIMKSTDGGLTWQNVGRNQMETRAVSSILVYPGQPNVVIATTGRGMGAPGRVYRSTNFGETWTSITANNQQPTNNFTSISLSRLRTDFTRNLYVIGGRPSADPDLRIPPVLLRSRDRGITWTSLPLPAQLNGDPYVVASEISPNRVYILGSHPAGRVYRSEDAGATWTNITQNLTNLDAFGQTGYNFFLGCMRGSVGGVDSDILLLGQIDLFMCSNPTAPNPTWVSVGRTRNPGPAQNPLTGSDARTHSDQHSFALHPNEPNRALIGNDGGAYRVTYTPANNDLSFINLNAGLAFTQFYDAAMHPTVASRMIGGTQDNAFPNTIRVPRQGDLFNWQNAVGGDGMSVVINPNNPDNQYAVTQFGNIYRTDDNWASWHADQWPGQIRTGNSQDSTFREPVFHQATTDLLYHANWSRIDRYNPATNTWTNDLRISRDRFPWRVIAFAQSNANRIYAGSATGELVLSNNGGATWVSRDDQAAPFTNLPDRAITSIKVHPMNENVLLIGFSGFRSGNEGHLYRAVVNPGLGFGVTYTDVSGSGATGLPDVPINSIELDPDDPAATWYVATDIGVFMTNNGGHNWFNMSAPLGLPNVHVNYLEYVPATGFLNAATWGRGMWRIQLRGANLIDLAVNPTSVPGGTSAIGTVTLQRATNSGWTISLSSSNPARASVPSFIVVPSGQSSANFNITTTDGLEAADVTITASRNVMQRTANLTVRPVMLESLTFEPDFVTGGNPTTGRIVLDGPTSAPALITIENSLPSVLSVPQTVTVPAGASEVTFQANTFSVLSLRAAPVTSSYRGVQRVGSLFVMPPAVSDLTLTPDPVPSGLTFSGTVTLNGNAPTGGYNVSLSAAPNWVSLPAIVNVPAGSNQATFQGTANRVTVNSQVTITASAWTTDVSRSLTIAAPRLVGLTIQPDQMIGGNPATLSVTLEGLTAQNTPVTLVNPNPTYLNMPSEVVVQDNTNGRSIQIGTAYSDTVRNFEVLAKLGLDSIGAPIQIRPATVSGKIGFQDLTVSPSTLGNVTLQLRQPGTLNVFHQVSVPLSANGTYVFPAPVPTTFDLAVKHLNWLRTVRAVTTGSQDTSGTDLTLQNGDVNGDNVVNVLDFLALRAAFGASPGTGNWNAMADLDKNNNVGVADFLILRRNFGLSGIP